MKNLKTLAFLLCLTVSACTQQSQTISQWRGINRNGIYQEKNLLKVWPEAGPELLWLTEEVGNGYSSPVVADGQLFINGEVDSVSHLFAFDLKGKLLWKSPNGPEFFGNGYSANFPGSRSAPTVYHNQVFVSSGMGRIACLEVASGKEKWAVDMVADLGGKLNMFGYSESLLVDEKNVYCYPGGAESNVVALDKFTGKVVWTSKAMSDPVSFCSPLMVRLSERNVLVTLSREYMLGLDAATGELLWSHKEDSVKLEGEHCNTPVYADGFIYSVSADNNGNGAYKLELSADGKKVKELWRNVNVKNAMGGIMKIDGKLYCTSDDKKLKCLDPETGMVIDSLNNMRGSIIFADGHLYCYTDNGYVNLIKLSGSRMEVVSKFKIEKGTKEHFSHPVIADGVLYIRHGNALMAYRVK